MPDSEFGSILESFMAKIIICINFKIHIKILISSYLAKQNIELPLVQ